MGWWEMRGAKDQPMLIGDESIDIIQDCLTLLSAVYQESLQRNPTLEEVLKCIEIALATSDSYVDTGNREVIALRAKTRRRAKRHRYKVGDYFAIPLSQYRFAFGCILDISDEYGVLVVFFKPISKIVLPLEQLKASPLLFPPVYVGVDDAWVNGRWRIIGHEPLSAHEFSPPAFKMKDHFTGGWRIRTPDGRTRRARDEEAEGLEKLVLWSPEALESRLEKLAS